MKIPTAKPREPKQEDCCNSGCNPCIFEAYEKQLKIYQSYTAGDVTRSVVENAISQLEYSKFCVKQNIDLQNEHRLVLFKIDSETSENKQVAWSPGDHFLLKYLSEKSSCTRAYTPVKIVVDSDKYDFAIIVKRYNNGLVSNYLCDLNIGDVTLWRGPYGNYKFEPNKFRRIIMIAQGTGITPMYSIIKQVVNNENDMTKIVLLYCCKNCDCILIRDELYSFRSFWNFNYEVFMSHNKEELSCKYQEPITKQRLNAHNIIKFKPFSKTDQFLLCGSKKFMEYFKKLLNEENVEDESIVTF